MPEERIKVSAGVVNGGDGGVCFDVVATENYYANVGLKPLEGAEQMGAVHKKRKGGTRERKEFKIEGCSTSEGLKISNVRVAKNCYLKGHGKERRWVV